MYWPGGSPMRSPTLLRTGTRGHEFIDWTISFVVLGRCNWVSRAYRIGRMISDWSIIFRDATWLATTKWISVVKLSRLGCVMSGRVGYTLIYIGTTVITPYYIVHLIYIGSLEIYPCCFGGVAIWIPVLRWCAAGFLPHPHPDYMLFASGWLCPTPIVCVWLLIEPAPSSGGVNFWLLFVQNTRSDAIFIQNWAKILFLWLSGGYKDIYFIQV